MTKTYEETIRGTLDELLTWAENHEVLGEITLVIAGVEVGTEALTNAEMVAKVREYEGAGMDRKEAISTVAKELDLPKKLVYAAVVEGNKAN
jgi:16S rRNA (cytidine1402-2'-O)-methyltransferase